MAAYIKDKYQEGYSPKLFSFYPWEGQIIRGLMLMSNILILFTNMHVSVLLNVPLQKLPATSQGAQGLP